MIKKNNKMKNTLIQFEMKDDISTGKIQGRYEEIIAGFAFLVMETAIKNKKDILEVLGDINILSCQNKKKLKKLLQKEYKKEEV